MAVPGDGDTEALGHADGSEALVRGSDPDSMCINPQPGCFPHCVCQAARVPLEQDGSQTWGRGSGEDAGRTRDPGEAGGSLG